MTSKVDGTVYTLTDGILSLEIEAGSHEITKESTGNLYYMSVSQQSETPTTPVTPTEPTQPEQPTTPGQPENPTIQNTESTEKTTAADNAAEETQVQTGDSVSSGKVAGIVIILIASMAVIGFVLFKKKKTIQKNSCRYHRRGILTATSDCINN